MTAISRTALGRRYLFVILIIAILAWTSIAAAETPTVHPLEPPDRSSPRATLTTFLSSVDTAWDLYDAGNPGFQEAFLDARGCLDLNAIPPLVFEEFSAETALLLKDVLDRIELPPDDQIPDAALVAELVISQWSVPHTEISLALQKDGDQQGQWLFSANTVANAEAFYRKVRHLPYQPGRKGGHVEELRSGTNAILLLKLVEVMPSWFSGKLGGLLVWQWFGLGLLVVLLVLAVSAIAWIGRKWGDSRLIGNQLGAFLLPLALMLVPLMGDVILRRIFHLPGAPALVLRLVLTMVGYLGLAWLAVVGVTRLGELVVKIWFRRARPLKKQLVRVVFRVATIVVVTVVMLKALQLLGVPVAGLIAGLGVGGLAIALAAQSTLENFIGGIILYADQPVKVGDICRFGERRGTVEDVGLRSTKIRTLDQTLVTIPNGDFAKMELENLSERDRILLREELCLRYETTLDQLRQVISEFEAMLRDHPDISDERLRVRLNKIGEHYFEIQLYCLALTGEWPAFTRIREDVLLKAMKIIENAGTRLALPTEIHYAAEQSSETGPMT
jgi:MscS family membrane protein